jgi:hypothetical protein
MKSSVILLVVNLCLGVTNAALVFTPGPSWFCMIAACCCFYAAGLMSVCIAYGD